MSKRDISFTAWIVIICLVALHNSKRWSILVSDEMVRYYRFCADYCARQTRLIHIFNLLPPGVIAALVEFTLAKGAPQHFALRKQAVREYISGLVGQGIKQVVVLGGGFDRLAYEMSIACPDVTFFELDVPPMRQHKMKIISEFYGNIPGNYISVSCELGKLSLSDVLKQNASFDTTKATAYIAEGVSMYISTSDFSALLRDIKNITSQKSHFIFTAIEPGSKRRSGVGATLHKLTLNTSREAFNFTMDRAGMAEFLRSNGFVQESLVPYHELQAGMRSSKELDALAKVHGEYLVSATSA